MNVLLPCVPMVPHAWTSSTATSVFVLPASLMAAAQPMSTTALKAPVEMVHVLMALTCSPVFVSQALQVTGVWMM